MKKIYKIISLLIIFILLTTYNPENLNLLSEKKYSFFKIKNIHITNTNIVEKSEIIKELNNIYNKNILFIGKRTLENPLLKIDFLQSIEVKKKYPDTIIIKILETKPVGIVFKDKVKYFLDDSSNLVIFKENLIFDYLPTIFGNYAEKNFNDFLKQLKKYNFPYQKVKNYYYYQIGRWDLQLLDDKIIKFPHNNINGAIKKSVELLNREDFKNYKAIDLRIQDKIIVE
tara:strand:+ start:896 stop:1579 length:684 start_codon:yes stop_codon:yes gene_type:complete